MTFYFAERGFVVHGCGTSRADLEDLTKALPYPHTFSNVDLADDNAVGHWAGEVLQHSTPRLLINNAARIAKNAPLWEHSADDVDQVVDVNIKGTINTIRHFVPAMIKRRTGVIVNFSSGWGRSTSPEVATYCASKFAIEGLTASLAQELPRGLAAVALNPGIINTEMLASCFGSGAEDYPTPSEWVRQAGPFLLGLGPDDNGASLNIPCSGE